MWFKLEKCLTSMLITLALVPLLLRHFLSCSFIVPKKPDVDSMSGEEGGEEKGEIKGLGGEKGLSSFRIGGLSSGGIKFKQGTVNEKFLFMLGL